MPPNAKALCGQQLKIPIMSRDNILHLTVVDNPDDVPANRLRGTSTGIALRCLADAILKPGNKIIIKDHADHRRAHQHTQGLIVKIAKRLQLVNIELGYDTVLANHWVRFNIRPTTTADNT